MTVRADPRSGHAALFYDDEAGYLTGVDGFIQDSLDRGEAVLVAVPTPHLDLLRDHFAEARSYVAFADMTVVGLNPSRIIPAISEFVAAHRGSRTLVVGEPIWVGRSPEEIHEATRHEALINLAFAEAPTHILCPYDTALDADVLSDARCTHSTIIAHGHSWRSGRYADPVELCDPDRWPLSAPPADSVTLSFGVADLSRTRAVVREVAVSTGFSSLRVEDVVLVVNELCCNAVQHGGGSGALRSWAEEGTLYFEVADSGHIQDMLADRQSPKTHSRNGRGLYLVHQVADLTQLRSGSNGTTVRVTFRP
jgi:anti-sigma regulatory factor (Ser/Thr protein kinase)